MKPMTNYDMQQVNPNIYFRHEVINRTNLHTDMNPTNSRGTEKEKAKQNSVHCKRYSKRGKRNSKKMCLTKCPNLDSKQC